MQPDGISSAFFSPPCRLGCRSGRAARVTMWNETPFSESSHRLLSPPAGDPCQLFSIVIQQEFASLRSFYSEGIKNVALWYLV
ncbi:hypothetical protein BaRGS_00000195 [Batillaria attramentaria]|uniref:Uncharacterized protein n=1 Tax=Batillaria attramentaria TaxID=370345 RepID=A0ABD0MBR3_9CAEN